MVTIQIYPSKLQTLVSSTLAFPLSLSLSLFPLYFVARNLCRIRRNATQGAWNFERIGATRETKCRKLPLHDPTLSFSLSLSFVSIVFFKSHARMRKGGEEMAWARSDRRFTRVINRSSYIAPSKNLGETPNQTFRDSRLFLSVFLFFFFFFFDLSSPWYTVGQSG